MRRPVSHSGPLLVLVIVVALGLGACADGGAIVSGGAPCNTELSTASGLWIGSANFVGGGTIVGLIGGGNAVMLQLIGDNPLNNPVVSRFYVGTYGNTLTGTADVYDGGGRLLATGQELRISAASTLNVTVGAATSLMPLCPIMDGLGNLLYERSVVNQEGVNMLIGTYLFEVPNATPPYTLEYTMATDGGLSGTDTPGCNYLGNWRLLTAQRNLYRLEDMTLTDQVSGACDGFDESGTVPFAGSGYEGFAFFLDANPASAQLLWAVVSNGEAAYFNPFNRVSPPPAPPVDDDDF